jgi:hypothetical protein
MMEKYLNDTLRTEKLKDVERIASANLMPGYLGRLQYIEDSTRAYKWYQMTKDSSYIRKFLNKSHRVEPYVESNIRKSAKVDIKPTSEAQVNTADNQKQEDVPQNDRKKSDDMAIYMESYLPARLKVLKPVYS